MMSSGRLFEFHDIIYHKQPCNVDNRWCNIVFTGLTHKKIKDKNKSFRVYNDSAIWNIESEFPVTLVWTETCIFTYVLIVH